MSALLSVRQVAARLTISETSVRDLCIAGKLVSFRVGARGGRIRVDADSVERYLDSVKIQASDDLPPEPPRRRRRHYNGLAILRSAGYRPGA